jgi:hypothetical protein
MTYWRSGGIAPRVLDLGTRCRGVVSFTPRPLYPKRKSPWYPLDRRLSGPQSRSGHGGEEENSKPLSGLEPQIIQPVAQCCTTELSGSLVPCYGFQISFCMFLPYPYHFEICNNSSRCDLMVHNLSSRYITARSVMQ